MQATRAERLAPLALRMRASASPPTHPLPSSLHRLVFSYEVLTPAALTFFVSYADGAVESLWSIDQYFEFVLVLMLSTGLAFQVGRAQPLLRRGGPVQGCACQRSLSFSCAGSCS